MIKKTSKLILRPCRAPLCLQLLLQPKGITDIVSPVGVQKSIQFSWVPQSCPTLCDPMDCSMPGFPVHHQLPELAQTHVHQVSGAIQPSHPLSFASSPAFSLSQHQSLFQWVSSSHQVVKVLEFQLQHQFFQWIFRTDILYFFFYISFRMDWLDLLLLQGPLKSLLQHHSSKASILRCSAFSIVQLSYPYMTARKNIALTKLTCVSKVISLPFICCLGWS